MLDISRLLWFCRGWGKLHSSPGQTFLNHSYRITYKLLAAVWTWILLSHNFCWNWENSLQYSSTCGAERGVLRVGDLERGWGWWTLIGRALETIHQHHFTPPETDQPSNWTTKLSHGFSLWEKKWNRSLVLIAIILQRIIQNLCHLRIGSAIREYNFNYHCHFTNSSRPMMHVVIYGQG